MPGDMTPPQRVERVVWRAWWVVAALPGLAVLVIAAALLSRAVRYVVVAG